MEDGIWFAELCGIGWTLEGYAARHDIDPEKFKGYVSKRPYLHFSKNGVIYYADRYLTKAHSRMLHTPMGA